MSSWATVLAYTGFRYDGVDQLMTFKASDKPVTWFWSSGDAWGTVHQNPQNGGTDVKVVISGGSIAIAKVSLTGGGSVELKSGQKLRSGDSFDCRV